MFAFVPAHHTLGTSVFHLLVQCHGRTQKKGYSDNISFHVLLGITVFWVPYSPDYGQLTQDYVWQIIFFLIQAD